MNTSLDLAKPESTSATPARLPFISVDDHLIEPANIWVDRLPAKYRDIGPRLVENEEGGAWHFEGKVYPIKAGFTLSKEVDPSMHVGALSAAASAYKRMRPGCYSQPDRLADMDIDGVIASMCFPSFPKFTGQRFSDAKDKELGLLCIQAYNDWMIDEWCGGAPGRFIPLCLIPMWDTKLATQEIARVADKGARAISFLESPASYGYPSLHDADQYWAPVFDAVSEADIPLCAHIASAAKSGVGPDMVGTDAPQTVNLLLMSLNPQITLIDWLLSGVFVRHPKLKLTLSEGGIGWIPYILERADFNWRHRVWGDTPLTDLPSTYFKDHVYGCFIDDVHGIESIEKIGADNVMLESDYPHSDSCWPHSSEIAASTLSRVDSETRHKIAVGNAMRLFNFTPAGFGQ